MTDRLTIALAQLNPCVGDVVANADLVRAARADAAKQGADLVMTGELIISGYPPEDLVLKGSFQEAIRITVEQLALETNDGGPGILLSAPWVENGKLYNAALLLDGGRISAVIPKHDLPNYSVFDEKRLFVAGPRPGAVRYRGLKLGIMTCEDMWLPEVTKYVMEDGADILLVLNGSPYEMDKTGTRIEYARKRVSESGLALVYVNQVGGQDELVFDGASFVLNADGEVCAEQPAFESNLMVLGFDLENDTLVPNSGPMAPELTEDETIYKALVLVLRDYVNKNKFPGVLIGMSGGVDSALTAAVAVDALGADRVHCVMMPSPYTSKHSLEDAALACKELGVKLDNISIEPLMGAFDETLKDMFAGQSPDTTEENIQARSRGIILMALSNKFGNMVVSTGNKSEMSVGYSTLYGDMCGGFNVLKDVYKTRVFALCRWRNAHYCKDLMGPEGEVVPKRIITKPPSAELKPDQTDQDTLPPYDKLDDILYGLIEEELSVHEISARGHSLDTVQKVWRMLDRAEYKRRQAPPGVKITSRAFGRDRRYPLTNGFTALIK
ncbi:MAG: NAD+ synthase [Rhodospirillaceae bacterium]|nr:MAG: NAD+ synthase [Rhodospirillaceae bacterium]